MERLVLGRQAIPSGGRCWLSRGAGEPGGEFVYGDRLGPFDGFRSAESRFLYSLLGSLVQGRLVGVIKNALRQLLLNCQPQARNRTMSLLQGVMAYPGFNMGQILKLEKHFTQYGSLEGSWQMT